VDDCPLRGVGKYTLSPAFSAFFYVGILDGGFTDRREQTPELVSAAR